MKSYTLFALLTSSAMAGDFYNHLTLQEDHDKHAHSAHHSRPDAHAPIGVMGGHTHAKGELMFSYRFMSMSMEDNYDGSDRVSEASVLRDFVVAPTDMDMEMHMFGMMYAPTDRLTLMAMTNLVDLSMNHLIGRGPLAGRAFETRSSGLGDSSIGGLYQFHQSGSASAHFGLNVLLPTADLENEDYVPLAGREIRIPYPMQLGHGSWGIEPSLTYLKLFDDWSLGSQVSAQFFLSENSESYRLGNRVKGSLWAARRWTDWFSTSARLEIMHWGNISGQDRAIVPALPSGQAIIPTADPDLRGGTRIDASIGMNILIPGTPARFSLEGGIPIYQDLDGPQLGSEWFLTSGLQFRF